ncbi:MAG TPA: ABC transporter ATP-binding protein [Acidimicrobiales bacterium]|nr:ABC transporter ATP-binding protein [Acidimicrobiales bacterium]
MLVVEDVVKTYRRGRVRANDGVSLRAEAGEVLGVLGPNGAGKTTIVQQVLGLVRPDSGRIEIGGVDVIADRASARRSCAYQPQAQLPLAQLRPVRSIEITARLRGATTAVARERARALLERFDLEDVGGRPMQDVSGGVARLVGFCMAIAHPTPVVVLDEPTNDVDPLRRRTLWEIVRETADAGSAVVLVTHNVHEAERAVDRLVVMDGGRVVVAGRPSELRRGRPTPLRREVSGVVGDVPSPEFLVDAKRVGARLLGGLQGEDVEEAVRWCQQQQAAGEIEEFSIAPVTLEDVYVETVRS